MNDFIAFHTKEGRAENLVRLGIHQDFHESLGLAFLHCTADARHRTFSDQNFPS
jgi:hypothetical protein